MKFSFFFYPKKASPQVASSSEIDCAFEDDSCGWANPERRDDEDELNWERIEGKADGRFPQTDHTVGSREGRPSSSGDMSFAE